MYLQAVVVAALGAFLRVYALENALSRDHCLSHDPTTLLARSNGLASKADELLSKSFSKIVSGMFVIIIDEQAGEEVGGETNPFGAYGTFIADGAAMFPQEICNMLGHEQNPICNPADNTTLNFLLGPRDVVAWYGCTPPPMKYFGFDPIIGTRITEEYPFYPGTNFGDAINQQNVKTANSEQDGIFDQPVLVLHAADGDAADIVSQAYADVGVDSASVNVREIDPAIAKLYDRSGGKTWEDTRPDLMAMLTRYGAPDNTTAEEKAAWAGYKVTRWPVRYYIADDEELSTAPFAPAVKSRESSIVKNEVDVYAGVLAELKSSVLDTFASSYSSVGDAVLTYTGAGLYDDWEWVLEQKNNDTYMMPTRDALYGMGVCPEPRACQLKDGDAGVLMGVIHSEALDAAYYSVGLDVMDLDNGAFLETHWYLDKDLVGSAERYFSEASLETNQAEVAALFAIDFLPPGGCAGAAHPQWCVEYDTQSYAESRHLMISERIYSVTASQVGPAKEMVVTSSYVAMASSSQV